MFKDKVFSISFLISLMWHILCIFTFVLVITPKGFTLNKFPETAFLGPILETNAPRPAAGVKPVFMITPYREDFASSAQYIEIGFDYMDKLVLLDDNLEHAEFLEPQENKQTPDMVNDKN